MTPRAASTSELTFSAAVPVVVTSAPIEIEKPQIQPVAYTLSTSSSTPRTASTYSLSPSAAVPDYLSSISVLKKPSPEITEYIITRVCIEK